MWRRNGSWRMRARRCGVGLAAYTASALIATSAWACGFHASDSVIFERAGLGWSYPNALHVQGAVGAALHAGLLRPDHFTKRGKIFAYHRTLSNLQLLGKRLNERTVGRLPDFSMVLLDPMLWTVFERAPEGQLGVKSHADGPKRDAVVVVTDVPVIAALAAGDISVTTAKAAGVMRFYGAAAETEMLYVALVAAFSEPSSAAIEPDSTPLPHCLADGLFTPMKRQSTWSLELGSRLGR